MEARDESDDETDATKWAETIIIELEDEGAEQFKQQQSSADFGVGYEESTELTTSTDVPKDSLASDVAAIDSIPHDTGGTGDDGGVAPATNCEVEQASPGGMTEPESGDITNSTGSNRMNPPTDKTKVSGKRTLHKKATVTIGSSGSDCSLATTGLATNASPGSGGDSLSTEASSQLKRKPSAKKASKMVKTTSSGGKPVGKTLSSKSNSKGLLEGRSHADLGEVHASPSVKKAAKDKQDKKSRGASAAAKAAAAALGTSLVMDRPPMADADLYDLCPSRSPCMIADAELRGISLHQLRRIVQFLARKANAEDGMIEAGHPVNIQTLDLYDLHANFILPATKRWECSLVEVIATIVEEQEQRPDYFVSHWWGTPFIELTTCLQEASRKRRLQRDYFWISAFAMREKELTEGCDDLASHALGRAMARTSKVIVVVDPNGIVFHRMWCMFELFLSTQVGVEVIDLVTFISSKSSSSEGLVAPVLPELVDGSWPLPNGEEGEVRAQLQVFGKVHMVSNKYLPEDFNLSNMCVKYGKIKKPATADHLKVKRERAFPSNLAVAGLRFDIDQSNATLYTDRAFLLSATVSYNEANASGDGGHRRSMEDLTIGNLRTLSAGLKWGKGTSLSNDHYVNATVHSCIATVVITRVVGDSSVSIEDAQLAVKALCKCHSMKELRLQLGGTRFCDDMVRSMSTAVQPDLKLLALDLGCTRVSDNSATHLASALRRTQELREFDLKFLGRHLSSTLPMTISEGVCTLNKLQSLSLYFTDTMVGDKGISKLSNAIGQLDQLRKLWLGFSFTMISDVGVIALSKGIGTLLLLEDFSLSVNNMRLTSSAMFALGKAVSEMREMIELYICAKNTALDDRGASAIYRAAATLPKLKEVMISFDRSQVTADIIRARTLDEIRLFARYELDPDDYAQGSGSCGQRLMRLCSRRSDPRQKP